MRLKKDQNVKWTAQSNGLAQTDPASLHPDYQPSLVCSLFQKALLQYLRHWNRQTTCHLSIIVIIVN